MKVFMNTQGFELTTFEHFRIDSLLFFLKG